MDPEEPDPCEDNGGGINCEGQIEYNLDVRTCYGHYCHAILASEYESHMLLSTPCVLGTI